jgi:hypothetical protein
MEFVLKRFESSEHVCILVKLNITIEIRKFFKIVDKIHHKLLRVRIVKEEGFFGYEVVAN